MQGPLLRAKLPLCRNSPDTVIDPFEGGPRNNVEPGTATLRDANLGVPNLRIVSRRHA